MLNFFDVRIILLSEVGEISISNIIHKKNQAVGLKRRINSNEGNITSPDRS